MVKGEAYPALSWSLPLPPKSVSSWEAGSGGITEETRVWLAGQAPGQTNPVCFPPSSQVDLHIPKVSISKAYDLGGLLKDMGIADLLAQHANFSGITPEVQLKLLKVSVSESYHSPPMYLLLYK